MKKLLVLTSLLGISFNSDAQVPNYVSTNGLVAWYPFNGNANDESSNTNDGTVNGATLTTDRFGNSSAAYSFDGINDLIDCGNVTALNGIPEMTISAWFKSSGNVFYSRIIGKELDQDNMEGFTIQYSTNTGNNLRFNMRNGVDAQGDNSTVAITDNQWYNVVMVYNGNETTDADKLKMFIDGVQVNLSFSNTIPSTTSSNAYPLWIGNIYGAPTESPWHGEIDDIGLWNRALTQQEISDVNSGGSGNCLPAYVPTNGLQGWYPFCGNANDESGNGNNGAVNGAILTTDRFGNPDAAYDFDGVNDIIGLPVGSNVQGNSARSISAWYSLTTPAVGTYCVYKGGANSAGGDFTLLLKMLPSNKYYFHLRRFQNDLYSDTLVATANSWHMVTVNYDGSTNENIEFYSDGVQIGTIFPGGFAGGLTFNTPSVLPEIGHILDQEGAHFYFDGIIDDLGIWNRDLSACEIQQLYTSQIANPIATVSTNGATTFCQGGDVVLTASVGDSYLWSNGETTQSITVTDADDYSVTVTDENGCAATSQPVTVTVLSNPSVTLSPISDLCADATPITLTGGSPVGGGYTINGNSATELDPSVTGIGSQTVVYTYTDQNNCSASATQTVMVNTLPTVSLSAFSDVCENDQPLILTGGSPSGGTYTLNGNIATELDPSQTGTGSQTIVYSFSDQNGCGKSTTQDIMVNAAPTPTITTSGALTFCQGGQVELTSSTANSYDWSTSASTQSIIVSTTATYTVTVTDANNCSGTSQPVSVTVLSNPTVSLSPFSAICENASAIPLSGGSPSGGSFTVNGNSATELDPSLTGSGTQTIVYTYTDQNNCTGSASQNVMVNSIPNVTLSGLNTSYLLSDNPSALTGTPSGGFFNGTGVANGMFDPAVAGLGTHGVSYAVADGNGCIGVSSLCTTVDLNVGIDGGNQISNGGGLDIYPNPANGIFNVTVKDIKGAVTYTVFDVRGREVLNGSFVSSGNYTEVVDLQTSTDGVYTIQVNSAKGIATQKLVKE